MPPSMLPSTAGTDTSLLLFQQDKVLIPNEGTRRRTHAVTMAAVTVIVTATSTKVDGLILRQIRKMTLGDKTVAATSQCITGGPKTPMILVIHLVIPVEI